MIQSEENQEMMLAARLLFQQTRPRFLQSNWIVFCVHYSSVYITRRLALTAKLLYRQAVHPLLPLVMLRSSYNYWF